MSSKGDVNDLHTGTFFHRTKSLGRTGCALSWSVVRSRGGLKSKNGGVGVV